MKMTTKWQVAKEESLRQEKYDIIYSKEHILWFEVKDKLDSFHSNLLKQSRNYLEKPHHCYCSVDIENDECPVVLDDFENTFFTIIKTIN